MGRHRNDLLAELAAVDAQLAAPEVVDLLARVQGLHSMARLTAFNLSSFEEQVAQLSNASFSRQLLMEPRSQAHLQFVERLQHLMANYVLSAVPLLEHARSHVVEHYPDGSPTRVQYERGLDMAINHDDRHKVIVQLRHQIAHRSLPAVTLIAGNHGEQVATPVIDRRPLLADRRCKGRVREILESLPMDAMSLDGLILADGSYVMEFVEWFAGIQAMHEIKALTPVGRLQQRREAILGALEQHGRR